MTTENPSVIYIRKETYYSYVDIYLFQTRDEEEEDCALICAESQATPWLIFLLNNSSNTVMYAELYPLIWLIPPLSWPA